MNHEPALLRSADGKPMVLERVEASGRLRGLLFELSVEQRYRNPHSVNIEAVYTFPLPVEAVLLDLDVEIGARKLAAVVVEKRAAEERYEAALDKGDSAVLLERAGDGLCTLNLGNLMAGEHAVIRYRYAQLLRFEHGSLRLAIPTVIAPRYGDPARGGLAPHQAPATDLAAAYPFALALEIEGDAAGGRLHSPSHPIDIARTVRGVRVVLAAGAFLDRDFVLNVDGLEARSLGTLARDGDGCVAIASFCATLPAQARPLPLALKLLVDCSGSMAGDSIAAARRALHRVLMGLERGDRFSLSRFGDQVRHDTRGLVPADAAAIRAGAEALAAMDADLGGTQMALALRAVFALGKAAEASDVLAITDGEVWDAEGLVQEACKARQRVFVIGIGSAPAEGVLRRLAEASGGACAFVAPEEDVEAAILAMFARMRAPRVERVEIAWPAPPLWQAPLPSALFGGETVHAIAGFAAPPIGEASIALVPHGDGTALRASAALAGPPAEDDTLSRVAAARRLATLDDAAQLDLALRYRLLTDRTNLLVVAQRAEGEKAKDLPKLATVAQMHAAGWHGLGSVQRLNCVAASGIDFCASSEPDLSMDKLDLPVVERRSSFREMRVSDASFSLDEGPAFRTTQGSAAPVDWPASIDRLLADGVPGEWEPVLRDLVREGFDEAEVCAAFVAILAEHVRGVGKRLARHPDRQLRQLATRAVRPELRARLTALLAGAPDRSLGEAAGWLQSRLATPASV